jgi:hypothetical protein
MIDSISHRYFGTEEMIVKDNNGSDTLTIALDLAGYVIHIRRILPKTEEIATLNSIV